MKEQSRKYLHLVIGLGLVAAILLVMLLNDTADAQETPTERTYGCVIRFDQSRPRILANSTHACTSVTRVRLSSIGDLVIDRSWTSGDRIVSVTAAIDESLAQRGIFAGGSGGGPTTTVRMYDRSGVRVRADSTKIRCAGCNLWMTWVEIPVAP